MKKGTKAPVLSIRAQILEGFKHYVLDNGHLPPSVYKFCKDIDLSEGEFYDEFTSLDAIDADIWLSMHMNTVATLMADEGYLGYSVTEKWLAYYYTILEQWKANRSFILWSLARYKDCLPAARANQKLWREAFSEYAKNLVEEGTDTGEVVSRPFITKHYDKGYWMQAVFILDFWLKDQSKGFELTDAAIEKAVRVGNDVVSSNVLDSALDFAKFVWQNR